MFKRFAVAACLSFVTCLFLIALAAAVFTNYKNITFAFASEPPGISASNLETPQKERLYFLYSGSGDELRAGDRGGNTYYAGQEAGKGDITVGFDDNTLVFDPFSTNICLFTARSKALPSESKIYRTQISEHGCKINFSAKDQITYDIWQVNLQVIGSSSTIERSAVLKFAAELKPVDTNTVVSVDL